MNRSFKEGSSSHYVVVVVSPLLVVTLTALILTLLFAVVHSVVFVVLGVVLSFDVWTPSLCDLIWLLSL